MKTIKYQKEELNKIKAAINNGDVIAFPTDTVYGLGVIYNNKDALNRLKISKMRPESKPIPMMVKDYEQLSKVAYTSNKVKKLYDNFMPGALTLVLKKKDIIPDYLTNGLDTIAIRIPNDKFVLSLLDEPMLVTSANISGEPSLKNDKEVLKSLDGRINGIVLGEAKSEISSSIIDVSNAKIKILRKGEIKEEDILRVLEEEE